MKSVCDWFHFEHKSMLILLCKYCISFVVFSVLLFWLILAVILIEHLFKLVLWQHHNHDDFIIKIEFESISNLKHEQISALFQIYGYVCDIILFVFSYIDQYTCNYIYIYAKNLLLIKEPQLGPWSCRLCMMSTFLFNGLEKHRRIRTGNSPQPRLWRTNGGLLKQNKQN